MATTATQQAKLEVALSSIQPLRDLARNWDVDIASWYERVGEFCVKFKFQSIFWSGGEI
jgi:hypothetical protein